MLKYELYAETSVGIRMLEKKLLSSAAVDRLAEAPNTLETLRQITQNSEYDFSGLKKPEDYETVLKESLENIYAFMYSISPDREPVDISAAKYEFHNLKTLMKSKYIEKDMSVILARNCGLDLSAGQLPEYITKAREEAEAAYFDSKDPQRISITLDKHMYKRMFALCCDIGSEFITGYTRMSADFYNIRAMMRAKAMKRSADFLAQCMVPGGMTDTEYFLAHYDKAPDALASVFYYQYFGKAFKDGMEGYLNTGNFSDLERLLDDRLIEYTKGAKYIAYGPEIVFAYIISKENEIRQIRILLACKINDIRDEILKGRLRVSYA